MGNEPTEYAALGELRLDDETAIVFAVYSLNKRRFGSARVYREGKGYAGPTRAGFDIQLEQLRELLPMLRELSAAFDEGTAASPLEVGRIASGRTTEWVVSLLEPDDRRDEVVLDIRKFVTTEKYTGWTKKGLRVSVDVLDDMLPHLASVEEALLAWQDGCSGLFGSGNDEGQDERPDDQGAPSSVPADYRDLF